MTAACNQDKSMPTAEVSVQVGIFFGGQLQNRTEWPLVIDTARQSQGFRIKFRRILAKPARVSWEITRSSSPSPKRNATHNESATEKFSATVPQGTDRFDQLIQFSENDRFGVWKLRIAVDDTPVWNHPVHVIGKTANSFDD
jgi:hypothetical protein